eukprot:COSAG06_NODE_3952_length_4727_cov_2.586646_5_plen_116_part_00
MVSFTRTSFRTGIATETNNYERLCHTGSNGQLFAVPVGAEPADAAIDFGSTTCRRASPGDPGFSYTLLYNETAPAALPVKHAISDVDSAVAASAVMDSRLLEIGLPRRNSDQPVV